MTLIPNPDLVEAAGEAQLSHQVIIKAHLVGGSETQPSNALQEIEENERAFAELGALPPPFDPQSLCILLEHSNALRPNVDAYCANIDSHGHRFEPVIDFEAEDADERIAEALYSERLWLVERGELEGPAARPSPEELAQLKVELQSRARLEKSMLDCWAEYCCADSSFITVRRRTRMDVETIGNGFWEVLRNADREVAQIVYVPGFTMRLLPLDPRPVQVAMRTKVSDIAYHETTAVRRFRRYVQIIDGMSAVYFKEFGDPRTVSRTTGEVFKSVEALKRADQSDEPATEILHFRVHSPRSAYGVPRWVGCLLEVLGSRQASEVNFFYFQNKSVPPLALLVSGGRLAKSSLPRIEKFIEENIKGKKNFHRILILEAEGTRGPNDPQNSGRVRIELQPLTDAQQQDALFQNYEANNMDKVGASFRMPRLLRGDIRDFNRSCYSEDTETLTENGWKRIDDIGEGERIAAYHHERATVEYVVPAERLVYEVDEELVHLANEDTDVLVTPNHRMWVRPLRPDAKWQIATAGELPKTAFEVQVAGLPGGWRGSGEPLLPADLGQSRLKGWLRVLADILLDGAPPSPDGSVCVVPRSPCRLAALVRALKGMRWPHVVRSRGPEGPRVLISKRHLAPWLRDRCALDTGLRRLPGDLLVGAATPALTRLLDALLVRAPLCCGCCGVLETESPVLADQVQQVAVQLGRRTRMVKQGARLRLCVSEGYTTTIIPREHVDRVPYRGRVYCFSVPDHQLFVTRRMGKAAIQGNTALAALHFAEEQVFQPERQEFDFIVNRRLLADMGIRFWRFVSNAPVTRDPQVMAETIHNLVGASVLIPEEGRRLAGDVFNTEFKSIRAPWVKQPLKLTLAQIRAGIEPGSKREGQGEKAAKAEAPEGAPEILYVPAAELRSWFDCMDAAPEAPR